MDVDSTANCTCFNLRKAARAVTQLYDEALKPSGLRATQFSLLTAVATTGPVVMTALAKTLVMDRTTLTRNLRPLLDQGLLEVVAVDDRRQRPIALTVLGREKLDVALPLWREVQSRLAEDLGRDNWGGLLRYTRNAASIAARE